MHLLHPAALQVSQEGKTLEQFSTGTSEASVQVVELEFKIYPPLHYSHVESV